MVVTGRSRKAFAGNRTWVRIPPFPPIIKMDLQKEVHFNILKVGFERRTFPERIARKKKCEAGRLDSHLFRSSGGIRTPSISRANSEESEMRGRTIAPHLFRLFKGRWDSLRRLLFTIELRFARSLVQQVALVLLANRAFLRSLSWVRA